MSKKILFIFAANQYNVLNEMLWRAADYLEQSCGYFVGRYHLDDYEKVCQLDWDVICSSQATEFSKCKEADGRLHITWMTDHPHYLLPRMLHYKQMEKVCIACVDRKHMEFLKRYYGISHTIFTPHFAWKAGKSIPFNERKYEVFFPASAVSWEQDVACRYSGLEGALRVITERVISFLLENVAYSMEEGMEAVLREYGEDEEVLSLSRECMEAVGEYMDSYLRIHVRNKVIRALLAAGITVTVCGRNWSRFPQTENEKKYLYILGEEMPYTDVINVMADSKIVLNVMPWFKDGSHERVAMGSMNGAVCVTDSSIYLKENWGENQAVFYDWKNTEMLVEQVKEILVDSEKAEKIAENGERVAKEKASVKVFAEQIKSVIESDIESDIESKVQ